MKLLVLFLITRLSLAVDNLGPGPLIQQPRRDDPALLVLIERLLHVRCRSQQEASPTHRLCAILSICVESTLSR